MYTETEKKANYLTNELDGIYYSAHEKLYDTYNMRHVNPKNAKQAKEWLTAGAITVASNDDDSKYFTLVWNDPTKPSDKTGFETAQKQLEVGYTKATREIRVKDPIDGLNALIAFESTTKH